MKSLLVASLTLLTACASAVAAPPKLGEVAPDFELKALGGEPTKLSKVAEAGPVVLVVLRGYPGYQCPLCTKQVAEFVAKAEQFKAAKARVLFVYPGPADDLKAHADEFVRGRDYPAEFTFLLDPDYAFTKQYGLRWDAANETAYPSAFVLDGARKVTFAKVSKTHGGRATVAEVLAALGAK